MRCPYCSAETDPTLIRCEHCRLDRQAPLLWPESRVYGVRGIGLAALVAVAISSVVTLLSAASEIFVRDEVRKAVDAGDLALLAVAQRVELGAVVVDLAFMAVAAVLLIIWLWRARKNIDAFPEASAEYKPGWAIGGWFVPIGNFFIPLRVMRDVAEGSLRRDWVNAAVYAWWAAWLGSYCVGRVAGAFDPVPNAGATELIEYFDNLVMFGFAQAFLTVVAGSCLGMLIFSVTRAQHARIQQGLAARVPVVMPAAPGGTIGL
ncbi:hypothetical protein CS0771_05030 [Catellatospora sp. IY07-71]|uniref:DUF4328 domain-containing protein n=1 Tax=Catellatospora sp. IY07-71 TaxID=2728827 RepID=UPI001BB43B2C|nr:DUF4328 domain-containing protein [Catellatospora sp. IY07-71]BCJ70959.1 hypothetical protein CS0771_05030 [Catellatospora sp. IY07-71]